MTQNRSDEERRMRELIVPELRKRCPGARIIHELPLRYSTNRIDLAAVSENEIIGVEIKSSKDVLHRLERQVVRFAQVCHRVIVAVAPKWNTPLPLKPVQSRKGRLSYVEPLTETQTVIQRCQSFGGSIETWTVDAEAGTVLQTDSPYRDSQPWSMMLLDMLHVSELVAIAGRYGCWQGKNPVHLTVARACNELMTGCEVVSAVCDALRRRRAFAVGTDPPMEESNHA